LPQFRQRRGVAGGFGVAELDEDFRRPSWFDGRRGSTSVLAARAAVVKALENEGMKTPADGAAIARLSRRLCELDEALGLEEER